MKLLLGESSGATGEDVDAGGLCLSSFNDIRFTKSDGTTLLDYWIESVSGATPNQLATIWIEFDSIGTGATTFYMYYGNAGASAASNGDNTFLFFDDFPGSALDGTKWNGSGSVGSSLLTLTSGEITGKTTVGTNTRFRGLMKYGTNSSYMKFGFYLETAGNSAANYYANHTTGSQLNAETKHNGSATFVALGNVGHNAYNIFEVKRNNSTNVQFEINGTNVQTTTTNLSSNSLYADIHAQSQTVYSEWVFISQFLGTEPAWGSWGAEEEAPPPPSTFTPRIIMIM
jgi:hypothetical protein